MDRFLNRAFNKVHGDVNKVQAQVPGEGGPSQDEEQAPTAIKRILECHKNKEYFKLLLLPDPVADELGRPTWECTSMDVSRAYRKMSVLVHPDKNPGDEARAAFEALNEAHRMLKDPSKLEEVLRDVTSKAVRERERQEAKAAGELGHASVMATKNAATKRLRQQQGAAFEDEIRQQMRKRQEEAARKAAAIAKARATALQEEEEHEKQQNRDNGKGGSQQAGGKKQDKGDHKSEEEREEEDEKAAMRAAMAARKKRKPTILN